MLTYIFYKRDFVDVVKHFELKRLSWIIQLGQYDLKGLYKKERGVSKSENGSVMMEAKREV